VVLCSASGNETPSNVILAVERVMPGPGQQAEHAQAGDLPVGFPRELGGFGPFEVPGRQIASGHLPDYGTQLDLVGRQPEVHSLYTSGA
jgi:hypothetical protein